ncbi:MAG: hypothetical protein SGJ00_12945 [bacterium]|nr:hypothetical protein [bacterium]
MKKVRDIMVMIFLFLMGGIIYLYQRLRHPELSAIESCNRCGRMKKEWKYCKRCGSQKYKVKN